MINFHKATCMEKAYLKQLSQGDSLGMNVQVRASAENIQLLTFDADGTLYEDGHHFEQNNKMINLINR